MANLTHSTTNAKTMLPLDHIPPQGHFKRKEQFLDEQELEKLDLPEDSDTVFEEEQSFDQAWIWILLGIEPIVILLTFILTGQPWVVLMLGVLAMGLTLSLMASLKLRTRIDDFGIHYRMLPFQWRETSVLWNDIDMAYVRTYSPISEYGGWGIRYGRNGKAYNVRGKEGIQIVKKNGKKILIGTQSSGEADRYLKRRPMTV